MYLFCIYLLKTINSNWCILAGETVGVPAPKIVKLADKECVTSELPREERSAFVHSAVNYCYVINIGLFLWHFVANFAMWLRLNTSTIAMSTSAAGQIMPSCLTRHIHYYSHTTATFGRFITIPSWLQKPLWKKFVQTVIVSVVPSCVASKVAWGVQHIGIIFLQQVMCSFFFPICRTYWSVHVFIKSHHHHQIA